MLGFTPGVSPTFGAGAMVGLDGLVVLDPVDGPVPPRLVWARARPLDRRKIAIAAHRRFIVRLRLSEGIELVLSNASQPPFVPAIMGNQIAVRDRPRGSPPAIVRREAVPTGVLLRAQLQTQI